MAIREPVISGGNEQFWEEFNKKKEQIRNVAGEIVRRVLEKGDIEELSNLSNYEKGNLESLEGKLNGSVFRVLWSKMIDELPEGEGKKEEEEDYYQHTGSSLNWLNADDRSDVKPETRELIAESRKKVFRSAEEKILEILKEEYGVSNFRDF